MAYNITLSTIPFLYTKRLCNGCASEAVDAMINQPICP
jgi:hypothetical protein